MPDRIDDLFSQYRKLQNSGYYHGTVDEARQYAHSFSPLPLHEPIPLRRAAMLLDIVRQMPVRMAPRELIVGSLMPNGLRHEAYPEHLTPDELTSLYPTPPVNHIIADYPQLLRLGLLGIQRQARERLADETDPEKTSFLHALLRACDAGVLLGQRYAEEARRQAGEEANPVRQRELLAIAEACERVPAQPARTFAEALQAVWFAVVLIYSENTAWAQEAYSPGRFDQYVYPFYAADLAAGRITPDQAVELVTCLFLKYAEIAELGGELFTLGGMTADGACAVNDVSYICLRATARLRLHAPKLMVRLTLDTPPAFLRECLRVTALGLGSPAYYNDAVALQALQGGGIPREEAWDYALLGCWEMDMGGREYGAYMVCQVNLAKCLEWALHQGEAMQDSPFGDGLPCAAPETFTTFAALLAAYQRRVEYFFAREAEKREAQERMTALSTPSPLLSALIDGCVASASDVSAGGARYNFTGSMAAGLANVADALVVIKRLVYETGEVTLTEIVDAMRADFHGYDDLRQRCLAMPKYGNDDDEVDALAVQLARHFCDTVNRRPNWRGGVHNAGLYSWEGIWPHRACAALPDGTHGRQVLAPHVGASAGRALAGPTAEALSAAKLDYTQARDGAAFILRLHPQCFHDEGEAVAALIHGYFAAGGLHIQFNVVDTAQLLDAQRHPELHQDLVVRVAGWSTRFVHLWREAQDCVIAQTEHHV